MDTDADIDKTEVIEKSLAEIFQFLEQLEQQVHDKQYFCQQLLDGTNVAVASLDFEPDFDNDY